MFFLFIGYSSILHQKMKGIEEKKLVAPREICSSFPSPRCFSHRQNRDEMPMNG